MKRIDQLDISLTKFELDMLSLANTQTQQAEDQIALQQAFKEDMNIIYATIYNITASASKLQTTMLEAAATFDSMNWLGGWSGFFESWVAFMLHLALLILLVRGGKSSIFWFLGRLRTCSIAFGRD